MIENLREEAFILNNEQRNAVLSGIVFACKKYEWRLYAAHVRSNHVHLVLKTEADPDRAMIQIKAYGTRFLKKNNLQKNGLKYWARGGSIKFIWAPEYLYPAMHYVIEEQGERMSCYYEAWYEKYSETYCVH